jgi:gliding motility-associated transport system permease protein
MSTTLHIAKREFRSYFDSPLAYVVICVSLVAIGALFFFYANYWQGDRATLTPLFSFMPWGLTVVVAVITMRLLAEEKRSGTLEMLITLPVRDHEVILGKFIGACGLVLLLLAATLAYPLMMFWWPWHLGAVDWGQIFSGYLGLTLYSLAAVAIGMLFSSLTESQVISFFLTFVLLGMLQFVVGPAGDVSNVAWIRTITSYVSFSTRLAPFARGVINTRDVVFFVSIAVGCLMASFRALERRKWA